MNKRYRYTLLSAVISGMLALVLYRSLGQSFGIVPLVVLMLPLIVFAALKENRIGCRPEVLINEMPTVMGMFSASLNSGGSFEGAVRNIADNGPDNISRLFKGVVTDADCRNVPGIRAGMQSLLSEMPRQLADVRRSMNIVMTAFDSKDPAERRSMMDDAEKIALEGLKDVGQAYSSGLSTPCMMIFGLGIMVPMMLVSFFPMLNMGGMFQVNGLDPDMITFITVAGIPAVVLMVIFMIRSRNPFPWTGIDISQLRYIIPLVLALPLYLALSFLPTADRIIVSVSAGAVGSLLLMVPQIMTERRRRSEEELLKDAMFELGNRLTMGDNFETALLYALRSREDLPGLATAMERGLNMCRGDVCSAITEAMSPVSAEMASYYSEVYRASKKDTRDSGRLATSIAHQIQDRSAVRKDIGNRLKSMLDMMTGTSAVFAPLILGMSVVMLGPISQLTGGEALWDVSIVLLVYLIELAGLISILSSNLMCKGDILDVESRFCAMVPIALIVFRVCSEISM